MKALILNSGLGHRMGVLTSEHPKCMTGITGKDTILSRQLRLLSEAGVNEVVMTTGYFDSVLVNYCHSLGLPIKFTFVKNPDYAETNYIYSIYCAREQLTDEDILLMHGDLVFEYSTNGCMMCLSEYLQSWNVDIIQFGYRKVFGDGRVTTAVPIKTEAQKGITFYESSRTFTNYLWDKVYRRSIFKNVVFYDFYYSEDAIILLQLYSYAETVTSIDKALYMYYLSPESLSRKTFNLHVLDQVRAGKQICEFLQSHHPELLYLGQAQLSGFCARNYTTLFGIRTPH